MEHSITFPLSDAIINDVIHCKRLYKRAARIEIQFSLSPILSSTCSFRLISEIRLDDVWRDFTGGSGGMFVNNVVKQMSKQTNPPPKKNYEVGNSVSDDKRISRVT